MKIAICSSITFCKEVMEIKEKLEKLGHEVEVPYNIHLYATGAEKPETRHESTQNKLKNDLIRQYFNEIKKAMLFWR